jgi:hypothetical protein
MPKASWIQNSFNAGELSPRLKGRIDIAKYKNGCDTLENFIPQIYGPVRKRPGTRFVNEVKDSSKNVRLIPFQFSTSQAYILEFGDKYIRFYMNGGVILDSSSVIYEVTTIYSYDEVVDLHYVQSADVLYLTHPNHPPHKLMRYDHDNWVFEVIEFDSPPFNDENITTTTITASATTGTGITLTASSAIFSSDSIGTYIKFTEVIQSKYDYWKTNVSISSGDYRRYDENLYKATSTGTTGVRPPVHLKGNESDGEVDWEYVHSGHGYAEITAYTSDTVVTADVIKTLPTSSTSGSDRWAESAWSPSAGYPKALTFYEDRLWFAGSVGHPQTLWASRSGDYENHAYGVHDDDALNYTINSQEVNTIQWLSPGKTLSVGTSGNEFTVSASSLNEAITPTNVKITPQTNYGGDDVQPFMIGSSILFVQRAGRKIREYVYSFERDSFVAPDMNLLADHITYNGVREMSYQQSPDQIVWVVDYSGKLLGLTYERAEDVVGWHRHDISGSIESISTIPHWDGDQDVTWLVVNRTINGTTKRYIEYIEKSLTDKYCVYSDSTLIYDGSPATTISGLDHLEGEEVSVITDGYVHPNRTVNSGEIVLQKAASVVVIGLPYTATLKTMPIEAGAADGTAQGKQMRVSNVVVRLLETAPGLYYGPSEDNTDEMDFRSSVDDMDQPVPLFTGNSPLLPWPGDYDNEAQITIQHKLALPCTVIAVMPQVHTYDR